MPTNRPLPSPLPADLPEDWQDSQIVAPEGADVGLTEQHGYNYLMQQVNDAQRAANQLQESQTQFQENFQEDLEQKQDKITGTQGQVVGFDAQGNAVPHPGVGRSMAGQSVEPTQGTIVTAGEGAEIFNDYRERTYRSTSPAQGNIANGDYSHAEGSCTTASGVNAHAEGSGTIANGTNSHSEGGSVIANGVFYTTTASGVCSHAEGLGTTASGNDSHSEGSRTTATGVHSHAEGGNTKALDYYAHAEGTETIASGSASHAEGNSTEAKGSSSHAGGYHTIANAYQTVVGTYNVEKTGDATSGDRFIVGGGWGTRKNAFRVAYNGNCFGSGSWNASGADYAELFEWQDGNPDSEDRTGLFVTLDGEHIRIAGPDDDYILGIVSATPSVVGDVYDDQWQGMEVRDVFGRTVMEMRDFPAEIGLDGEEITPERQELAPKLNPDYDHTIKYQPRTQRPEWDAVGLLGKLVAVDDGTCQVNGWATVGPGGVATASTERTKYRIMARLDAAHVRVMIL